LTDLWDEVGKRWKNELFLPQLVRHCSQNLPEVLTGAVDLLSLVFEKGSSETMEKIYSVSTLAQYCNGILKEIAGTIVASLDPARPIRMLEIGAGTGATTQYLLPILPAGRTTYVFTDLGPGFLQHAREKFSAFPFVTYQVLNIEDDPAQQGFDLQSFDVIVAANVLHATRQLRQTLANVRKLLAPGGFLLLWEATQQQTWLDVSFSLLEGWQRFEDYELRPDQPLLTSSAWLEVLRDHFPHAAVFPEARTTGEKFGQSVIVARAAPAQIPKPIPAPTPAPSMRLQDWTIRNLVYEGRWELAAPGNSSSEGDHEPADGRADLQVCPTAYEESRTRQPGTWLILADEGGVGKSLAQLLAKRGDRVLLCFSGEGFQKLSSETWRLDPSAQNLARLFEEANLSEVETHFRGLIYLWGLGVSANLTAESLAHAQTRACAWVARAAQSLIHQTKGCKTQPRLWLVTRGSQRVTGQENLAVASAQSLLWGLGRSLAVELPMLWGGLVDLDPLEPSGEAQALLDAILSCGADDQIALRAETR